jgi:hypothetical protein
MSDNVIKSTDVTSAKAETNTVKKAPAKKAAAKPKAGKAVITATSGLKVIIFECGASYVSGDLSFTREDNIKEVPEDQADFLLTLENFRAPNQIELEEFYNSKED